MVEGFQHLSDIIALVTNNIVQCWILFPECGITQPLTVPQPNSDPSFLMNASYEKELGLNSENLA
jgi:hypothetical protein